MRKYILYLLILSFSILLFSTKGVLTNRHFEILKNLEIFSSIFKEINQNYVDEINPTTLIRSGIDHMLESLDPYTSYIPANAIENYRIANTGEYSGIGAVIETMKEGRKVVFMVYEGFSAHKSGLFPGDEILAVNDVSIVEKNIQELRKLIKGQSHSIIKLKIKRYGHPNPLTLSVKREKISINSVPYAGMVNDSTGLIRLTSFTSNVGQQIGLKTIELIEKGAKSIILDLRENPGGLLHESVNVSNIFIPKGKKIVEKKGKLPNENYTFRALNESVTTNIPLVVLINEHSASASEIVSGVVQDYDRGVLIGRKTYGKGLVQVEKTLPYDAMVKITIAKYYTPTGRCIQSVDYSNQRVTEIPDSLKNSFQTKNGRIVYDGGGIDPDILVKNKDYSPISASLIQNGLIFDYATEFYFKNKEKKLIKDPKKFRLSAKQYQDFLAWLKNKNFEYQDPLKDQLKNFQEEIKKDPYYSDLSDSFQSIINSLNDRKEKNLKHFKDEISMALEQEICGRFFFERGIIESTFSRDSDIKEAVRVLSDMNAYNAILKK